MGDVLLSLAADKMERGLLIEEFSANLLAHKAIACGATTCGVQVRNASLVSEIGLTLPYL